MAAVTLTAKLVDKVSGPANKAAASIDKVNRAAGGFDKKGKLRDARGRFVKLGQAADGAGGSIAKATMKGNLMADAMEKVADMIRGAAMAVVRLALAFGRAVGKAALFGESLQFSLERFLGSTGRAKREIAAVMKLSNRLGLDFQATANSFKDLISAGFTAEAAKEMIAWKADLLAMGTGGPKAAAKIEAAFEHIQKSMAKGKMEGDSFNEILANLPINKLQIMTKLAKLTGKSVSDLMKMDITKLPIDKLMQAMQMAMLDANKAVKLGDTALAKQKKTIGGMISLIKARVGNIPDMIAAKLEGAGLKGILDDVLKALESPEARAIVEGIAAAMSELGKAALEAWPVIKGIVLAMGSVARATAKATAMIAEFTGASAGPMKVVAFSLKSIAVAIGVIVVAAGMIHAAIVLPLMAIQAAAMQAWEGLKAGVADLSSLGDSLISLGSAMINGRVAGIKAGAGAVVDAITGVASSAVSAAKGALGISSPSSIFENMGAMSALGYEKGFEGASAGIPAMSAGAVAPAFGGGGANVTQNNANTFNVTEAQSAEDTARMIKRMQLLEMASAFEQMAVEVGS